MTTPQASLSLRTGQLLHPASHAASRRRTGPHYRGPWRLPGPDFHRLVALSLSSGYVTTTSLSSLRPLCWAHRNVRCLLTGARTMSSTLVK